MYLERCLLAKTQVEFCKCSSDQFWSENGKNTDFTGDNQHMPISHKHVTKSLGGHTNGSLVRGRRCPSEEKLAGKTKQKTKRTRKQKGGSSTSYLPVNLPNRSTVAGKCDFGCSCLKNNLFSKNISDL